MKKYQLTLNEEQMRIMAHYLETACRLRCGQLDNLADLFHDRVFDRDDLDYCMEQAKILLFPTLQKNEFLGIFGSQTPKDAKCVYDVYKSIKHEFNKDSDRWNVDKEPHRLLASEYGIKIEVIDNE